MNNRKQPAFREQGGADQLTGGLDRQKCPDFLCASPGSDHVLPLKYSRWLAVSSLFFLAPAYLAFKSSLFYLAGLYATTGLVSSNYWRHACNGFRRNLDLVFAKLSFVATVFTGILKVDSAWLLFGLSIAAAIPLLYWASIELHRRDSPAWVIAHWAMHLFISLGMSVVVLASR